jgi:hypothetical protein
MGEMTQLKFEAVRPGHYRNAETGIDIKSVWPGSWTVLHEGEQQGRPYVSAWLAKQAAQEFWDAKTKAEAHGIFEADTPSDQANRLARRLVEVLAVHDSNPRPDPATTDDTDDLMRRVVRRAQYMALKTMLDVVNQFADQNGRDEPLFADDVRIMVNDAARRCGTAEPFETTT